MKRTSQLFSLALIISLLSSTANAQVLLTRGMLASFNGNPTTSPSSLEMTPIESVQIRIRTADRDDAGQDDDVMVRLNGANETWLDSGTDDFERGTTYTYDLQQVNASGRPVLSTLSDIRFLEISKTGSDGWCFSDIELIVNGRTVYQANYPRGQWLDNSGGAQLMHKIPGATLRGSSLWTGQIRECAAYDSVR